MFILSFNNYENKKLDDNGMERRFAQTFVFIFIYFKCVLWVLNRYRKLLLPRNSNIFWVSVSYLHQIKWEQDEEEELNN